MESMDSARASPPLSATTTAADGFEAFDLHCVRHDRTLFAGLSFTLAARPDTPSGRPQWQRQNQPAADALRPAAAGAGQVRWRGADIQDMRTEFLADVAYVGHLHGIKEDLSPRENLRMSQALGRARARVRWTGPGKQVGLYGFEDLPARTLSAGQRRRVALARLLVLDARLWVLDEPFTALDRTGKALIESLLETHSHNGGIAVLTTHQPVVFSNARR